MTMKKLLAALTLGASLAMSATPASAVPIATNEYLGSFPASPNATGFFQFVGASGFTKYWVFQLTEGQGVSSTVSFTPTPGGFTGFAANLYSVTATCATVNSACASFTAGSVLTPFSLDVGGYTATYELSSAGWYAIGVTGTGTSNGGAIAPSIYSGSVSFSEVPEPATLALFGLALAGVGAASRRRLKA